MTKYNIIRVITVIFVMLLIFAQSAYDPAVQARMTTLEDHELSEIDGEAIWMTFDITVRSVANDLYMIDTYNNSAFGFIGGVVLGDGTVGGNFQVDSTLAWDVGSSSDQTWLLGGNFSFPSSAGIGLIANNPSVINTAGVYNVLGPNVIISGFYFGRNVTSVTPQLLPGGTPWVIISAKSGAGIEFRSRETAYLDKLRYNYNTGLSGVQFTGIYVYGLTNAIAGGNPATWPSAQGQFILGGELPNVDTNGNWTGANVTVLTGMDVGFSGGANGTRPRLSMPMAGTLRVRDFRLDSAGINFGIIAIDDVVMYRQIFTFRSNL